MSNDQEFHNCPVCFIYYSGPKAMFEARRADGKSFYCPNGHSLSYRDNENDRIRQERDRLKQNAAYLEAETLRLQEAREAAERRASAMKGQVTRLKNRAANGVCPCCNRTFANLQRHMAAKHAGFAIEEVQEAEAKRVH